MAGGEGPFTYIVTGEGGEVSLLREMFLYSDEKAPHTLFYRGAAPYHTYKFKTKLAGKLLMYLSPIR